MCIKRIKTKTFYKTTIITVLLLLILLFSPMFSINSKASETKVISINQTVADTRISPDKYNTGAKGDLQPIGIADTIDGVEFRAGSNNTVRVLDLFYKNKNVTGTVVFENMDFTAYPLCVYNEDKVERDIKVIFRNCRFSSMSTGRGDCRISYTFENCTFNRFYGSNAVFEFCAFGSSISDGMVPFQNITVNNCFFRDMTVDSVSEKEVHTDGIQIYGNADTIVNNVHYNNCRFEVPAIQAEGSKAYVNACIMLQLEFNNAKDVTFNNCRVNGGGYSIYANAKYDNYTFENVGFNGIRYGGACKYGAIYPKYNSAITMNDFGETEYLYVGSVWKENGETHISVTNDTTQERKLVVYTDKGSEAYTIPACSGGGAIVDAVYEELPFDIDITYPADCQYVVCYDATISGYPEQIRYINWSDKEVTITQSEKDALLGIADNEPLMEGKCGENVTFSLSKQGVLTLRGTGNTYDYHSGKQAPWMEKVNYVKEIVIEEGIERLGNQIFANCTKVKTVTLPEGLTATGGRIFNKCSSLTTINLPSTLQKIGDAICTNALLQHVYYNGSKADWAKVTVGKDSAVVLNKLECLVDDLVPGDVNQDEKVDLSDAQTTLKAALKIVSLTEEQIISADVDADKAVTLKDAQMILKAALKIITL